MTKTNPSILYVGDRETGRELRETVESRGWWVELADERDEALGLYITCLPDAVVLDGEFDTKLATEVYHHLRSIEAGPLLVLTEDPRWDYRAPDSVYTMLPPTDLDELASFVDDVVQNNPMPEMWGLARVAY
ncbi:MAG: hypothetical protein JNJ61_19985 [Anaerolineae bacterium]|nr:hypothetical protein [Anaerolineae bacterium]